MRAILLAKSSVLSTLQAAGQPVELGVEVAPRTRDPYYVYGSVQPLRRHSYRLARRTADADVAYADAARAGWTGSGRARRSAVDRRCEPRRSRLSDHRSCRAAIHRANISRAPGRPVVYVRHHSWRRPSAGRRDPGAPARSRV